MREAWESKKQNANLAVILPTELIGRGKNLPIVR